MKESKYEKYVVRSIIPSNPNIKLGLPELGIPDLYHYLTPDAPIKEADTMVELAWITKQTAFGVTQDKPPHSHNCAEIFMFLGTNPKDKNDLGGEVEFWLGDGKETEKIKMNTSGLVFVPKGMIHLPVFFKNVKKPILWMIIALSVGETLKDTIKYPVRGI